MADNREVGVIQALVYRSCTDSLMKYEVRSAYSLSVMSLLAQLHAQDPTLACRTSMCFHGTCGSCLVNVNGRDVKGCMTLVMPGDVVTIRPHSKFHVIQDLVVDFNRPITAGEGGEEQHAVNSEEL